MLGLWKSETDTYLNSTRSLSLHEQWSVSIMLGKSRQTFQNATMTHEYLCQLAAWPQLRNVTSALSQVSQESSYSTARDVFFFFFKFDSTWQLLRRRPLTINNLSCQILTCKAAGRGRVGVYVHSDVWKLYCTRLRGNRAQPNSQLAVPPPFNPAPPPRCDPWCCWGLFIRHSKEGIVLKGCNNKTKAPIIPMCTGVNLMGLGDRLFSEN